MKKNFKVQVVMIWALMCMTMLVSCKTKENNENFYFVAEIKEVYEESCLVRVTDSGNSIISVDSEAIVPIVSENEQQKESYSQGDYIRIEFDGTVQETYPLGVPTVYRIEKEDI